MLIATQLTGFGGGREPRTLLEIISEAGQLANLRLCLDAADSLSYSGSGQTWSDRSGGGYNFLRGATASTEASDPTFNGTAGGKSANECWLFDGGDFFRYQSSNAAWMNNLHKDGAQWAAFAVVFPKTPATFHNIMGTNNNSTAVGFEWWLNATNRQAMQVTRAAGQAVFAQQPTGANGTVPADQWHALGFSVDEPAGVGFLWRDGVYDQVNGSDTWNATYTSPSTGAAGFTLEIAAGGNADHPLVSGCRLACLAVWEGRALAKADLDAIWAMLNFDRRYV